ncbi:MAG: cell division FtsA domain-containing protein, partial [Candidatus Omnitrophica bacterium]|nr:cell division FtsA domain-containing protein [Candidatus Omnitrophota bacterium]
MSEEIFALDIGTRKVMGLIACKKGDTVQVLDAQVMEHLSRPMFDGQIHSIEEVAKTVKCVKESLESRLGRKLTQAAVAVAGRNLVTYKTKVVKELDTEKEITEEIIKGLELEAVDKIFSDAGGDIAQYYCVGYSPVYFELEGNRITSLLGHRAKSITVEMIATFLPRVVLDSMFAVLKRTGLEATGITLEPIAAIQAIIPPEMRNLNIVLVDIGAGTSDLALTKDGYVFSYGMVPDAGDEITEYISEIMLTDFNGAEQIKRKLEILEEIEYEDIWSKRWQVKTADIKQNLLAAVHKLSESIAKKGLELNGAAPAAVVAVGGGSLTAGLMPELAKSFGMSEDKAGIRLPLAIKNLKDMTGKLTGPEAVTPIGIALMAVNAQGLRFVDIEINGRKIRMLDFQQKKDIL